MPRIIRHVIWPIGEALNYSEGRLFEGRCHDEVLLFSDTYS